MSAVEEILAQIPMGQLAGRLGVDPGTAEQAVRHALPALLGGIQANSDDPGGASSLARAVQQHDPGLVEGGVNLDEVDEGDGEKIVGHVFGAQREGVVNTLGGLGAPQDGAGGGRGTVTRELVAKLLPILAPIVMSWLAKRLGGGAGLPGGAPDGGGGGLGGILGGVLGSVLGGGSGGSPSSTSPNLGDILGGLLGGGRR